MFPQGRLISAPCDDRFHVQKLPAQHSQNNKVLFKSRLHVLHDLGTMSQSLLEVATFSEHADVGAPFHLTNHPSTRVGRDRLCQLCDGRFHVFKVLWTVPVDLVLQESPIDNNLRGSGQV